MRGCPERRRRPGQPLLTNASWHHRCSPDGCATGLLSRKGGRWPQQAGSRYGLDTTVAFTIMDVSVMVSFPCLARLSIMSSLVSSFDDTPGFHLTFSPLSSTARIRREFRRLPTVTML
jgi:hypothetical protein